MNSDGGGDIVVSIGYENSKERRSSVSHLIKELRKLNILIKQSKKTTGKSEIAKERMMDIVPLQLSENDLRGYKDDLYEKAKQGERNFYGLLEVIGSRENIIHAIRKVKSNSGFNTPGVDGITGNEFIQMDTEEVFNLIQEQLENYNPEKVRRVFIPKRNGKKRPLGIPVIIDRVIQTAIANIIEPIVEAQFYEHSYGFRPMRQIEHAYAYLSVLTNTGDRHWVVEGDIKSFFDNVDHSILIKKLYKYGIRDKRVIMLIKKILKAGIDGEKDINDLGTPQGGTLSPLLANIYLTDFDKWVDEQWHSLKTKKDYSRQGGKIRALKNSGLKQGYLIRYADDWIIVTDSEENAIKWKYACKKMLQDKLKIELSEEKTKITDLREEKMKFLGISAWQQIGSNNKFTLRTAPDPDRIKEKMSTVYTALRKVRKSNNNAELVENITNYNAIVRGINNFYSITTLYNTTLSKEEWKMKGALNRTIRVTTAKRISVTKCDNLKHYAEKGYKGTTLAFEIEGCCLGLEKLGTGKFQKPRIKAQWINPYSAIGRSKYEEITGNRWETFARNPWLTLGNVSSLIAKNSKEDKIYNLEYFINRAMAFNRDKGKCRVCGKRLTGNGDVEIHHRDKNLPMDKINKVNNLVTCCKSCHYEEHRKTRKKSNKQKPGNTSRRVSKKPPVEILEKQISETPITQIAKLYGVSDNAVRKWAKSYGIYDKRLIKYPKF